MFPELKSVICRYCLYILLVWQKSIHYLLCNIFRVISIYPPHEKVACSNLASPSLNAGSVPMENQHRIPASSASSTSQTDSTTFTSLPNQKAGSTSAATNSSGTAGNNENCISAALVVISEFTTIEIMCPYLHSHLMRF